MRCRQGSAVEPECVWSRRVSAFLSGASRSLRNGTQASPRREAAAVKLSQLMLQNSLLFRQPYRSSWNPIEALGVHQYEHAWAAHLVQKGRGTRMSWPRTRGYACVAVAHAPTTSEETSPHWKVVNALPPSGRGKDNAVVTRRGGDGRPPNHARESEHAI